MRQQLKVENTEDGLLKLKSINQRIAFEFQKVHKTLSTNYGKIEVNEEGTYLRLVLDSDDARKPQSCLTPNCPQLEELTDENWEYAELKSY